MARLTINQFCKTLEGQELVESQRLFVLNGMLFQGHQGIPVTVVEKQCTHQELLAAQDIDGTKQSIWITRRHRIGARHDRKANEYRKRRAELRKERETIENQMERRQRMSLPTSKADLEDLRELDERMERLVVMADEEEKAADGITAEAEPEPAAAAEPDEMEAAAVLRELAQNAGTPDIVAAAKAALTSCVVCGAHAAPGKDPAKWLRGHMMGKHKQKVSKAS